MNLYLENKELNARELRERKTILQSRPLTLRIILNNYCNINCIMCGIASQKNKFSVPHEVIKQAISFFPYLGRIDWQGGEVFLSEYFEDTLREVSFYPHIQQTLQTNGLLLNRRWAELLAKYNIAVLFSVDGTSKDTYEYIRRGARFKDLLNNISIFSEYRKKYNSGAGKILCVCVMKANYMEIEEFVEFAIKYNFNQVSFGAIHGTNAVSENIFNPPDFQVIEYIRERMPTIEKICAEKGIILECSFKSYLRDNDSGENYYVENAEAKNSKAIRCELPWTNLCIDAIRGGNVYPECLCAKSIGNIMKDSLVDIWNAPFIQEYRLAVAGNNFKSICSEYCIQIK